MTQRTIAREGTISGIGLHTGEPSKVICKPAAPNSGFQFFKSGKKIWQGGAPVSHSARCTTIGENGNSVATVEHLLSAFVGLEITNIRVDVEGPEIPGLDGSATPFTVFLKGLGIADQGVESDVYAISEPLFCGEPGKAVSVYPADEFSIAYTLDYEHALLKNQKVEFKLTPEVFEKEIAPARTFCTSEEADAMRKSGLGLGANYENTLVISPEGPVQNRVRFPDECARHKVLDLLGDLGLLGFRIRGRVVALRSGHGLNRELVRRIAAQKEKGGY